MEYPTVAPRRAGALFPYEFLDSRVGGIGDPDVAFRADRDRVGFAELTRPAAGLARRGEDLAVEVQAQDVAGEPVHHVDVSIADLEGTRQPGVFQFPDVGSVLIEDLDPLVLAIGDPEPPAGVDDDPMGNVELAGAFALSAPGLDEIPVPVELHDARIAACARRMPLSDEYVAVAADGDVGRLVDLPRLPFRSQRQQDLSFRTDLVDNMPAIVRRPHIPVVVEFQSVSPGICGRRTIAGMLS